MAGVVLRSIGALLAGFFAGWIVSAAFGFRYMEAAKVFDRDGGASMGLMFIVGPFFGVITALALAGYTAWKGLRRLRLAEAGMIPPPASTAWTVARGVVVAACVYLAVWLVIEFTGPYQLSAGRRLFVTDGIPALAGIAAGFVAALRRR